VRITALQEGGIEKTAEGVQLTLEPKRGSISYLSGVSFQGFQKKKKVLLRPYCFPSRPVDSPAHTR